MNKKTTLTFKNNWPKFVAVFFFLALFGAYVNIFAVFTPGQTLDPNCAPGAVGCTVNSNSGTTLPDQTGHSGKYLRFFSLASQWNKQLLQWR